MVSLRVVPAWLISSFLDKVSGYVDTGTEVDVIFLDFAKAFDKVRHQTRG